MRRVALYPAMCLAMFLASQRAHAEPTPTTDSRGALQPFNLLVGSWKATGAPEGTREEKQQGHWTETLQCEWHFKDKDTWISIAFDKGKYFTKGELRPVKDGFEFKVQTTAKESLVFSGALKEKLLTLERTDPQSKEVQRLVFSLLHANRILYRYESRPADKTFFTKKYQVGATKEGIPFAGDWRFRKGVHRQRRSGDDDRFLQGKNVLCLLFGVP